MIHCPRRGHAKGVCYGKEGEFFSLKDDKIAPTIVFERGLSPTRQIYRVIKHRGLKTHCERGTK